MPINIVRWYRLGARWMPSLPEPLVYAACDLAATAAILALPTVRRALLANLRHIQPALTAWRRALMARRTLAYVFRHYADLLRLPSFSADQVVARFEASGTEHLETLVARGGGLMAVPHSGSFSTVLSCLARLGFPLVLVVERIEPPELLDLISELRAAHGLEVLSLGQNAGREVLRALRSGKIVVLAGDRDLAAQPMRLPFFGAPAAVPSGPARLAIRGIPIVTAFTAWAEGAAGLVRIDPVMDLAQRPGEAPDAAVERAAAAILRRLETYIAAFPASWGVLQPVWEEGAASDAAAIDQPTRKEL